MIIGYARVSTIDQNLEVQRNAPTKAGCERVFEDHASGMAINRPRWTQALASLRGGDTLVVWRLDRLGRSLKRLIDTITELNDQGVAFRSLHESLYTGSKGGLFYIFGAPASVRAPPQRRLLRQPPRQPQSAPEPARAHAAAPPRALRNEWADPPL